jgi:hypothetical protein
MRFRTWFVLIVAALSAGPAVGLDRPGTPEEIARIALTHLDARRFFDAVRALPVGLKGVYVIPRADALLVRGSLSAVAEMRAAVAVVDVPVENGRSVVLLRRARPETIRTLALALPQAGTVHMREKTLQFEGGPDWLKQVSGLVFGAELGEPRPISHGTGVRPAPELP